MVITARNGILRIVEKMLLSSTILTVLCLSTDSALAFQCPVYQTPTGTVYGQITDAKSGLPVAGATVEAGAGIIVLSNQTGYYMFAANAPNGYDLTVSSQGYSTATQNVVVQTNGCFRADFPLQPATPQLQLLTIENIAFLLVGAILGGIGVFVATKRRISPSGIPQ